jgi:hypothetical protein
MESRRGKRAVKAVLPEWKRMEQRASPHNCGLLSDHCETGG